MRNLNFFIFLLTEGLLGTSKSLKPQLRTNPSSIREQALQVIVAGLLAIRSAQEWQLFKGTPSAQCLGFRKIVRLRVPGVLSAAFVPTFVVDS